MSVSEFSGRRRSNATSPTTTRSSVVITFSVMSLSVVLVALGSAVGGVTRFLLGAAVQHRLGTTFPVGTLLINVSGSLVLGFLFRFLLATPTATPEVRAMLMAGFC